MKKVIPAILTDNIADLKNKIAVVAGLTDLVQVDIMDGKFVNNTSISSEDILSAEIGDKVSLEIHLMVLNPETYFDQCQKINAKRVIFHFEAGDFNNILIKAKKFNFKIGLALNPKTSIEKIKPYLNELDFILLMSVNPGFQGQKFILETLDKIKELKSLVPSIEVEVDGGINSENIRMISDAGADYFVVGSSLFENENIKGKLEELESKIK